MTTYGERLAKALEASKKARKDLADHLGVSPSAIGQVINGTTNAMRADHSARTAAFLGVSHWWLATGEGEPKGAQDLEPAALSVAQEYQSLDESGREAFDAALSIARISRFAPPRKQRLVG